MDVEQIAKNMRSGIKDVLTRYEENEDNLRRIERELTDMSHFMELVDLNAFEGFEAYKEYQRLLKERRKCKDENELLKHLKPIAANMKEHSKKLDRAIGEIRTAKMNLATRKYKARVRTDLEKRINGVKS